MNESEFKQYLTYPWARNTPLAQVEEILDDTLSGCREIADEVKHKNEQVIKELKR